jgi:cold shock CspA family protein
MSFGRVKEYDEGRGYGVIVESPGTDEFVVYKNYIYMKRGDSLKVGQKVEFEKKNNRSEVWAINVKVLDIQD